MADEAEAPTPPTMESVLERITNNTKARIQSLHEEYVRHLLEITRTHNETVDVVAMVHGDAALAAKALPLGRPRCPRLHFQGDTVRAAVKEDPK